MQTPLNADQSCRWYIPDEAGQVEAECCYPAGHSQPHEVLFGYIPGSVSAGTEGDDGITALADADWLPPTGNPWSAFYTGPVVP